MVTSNALRGKGMNPDLADIISAGFDAASVTGGALGTPSSGTLTNCTGLPVTGVSGLGTNVATALAIAVGTAGAPVINGGALGTPSGGTLTNCTGLPAAGVSGIPAALASQNIDGISRLGIGTTDAGNVLSVSGASTLFANGAGSIRSTLSKYAVGDTASFVFQTNFSGRAEFGLCGDDKFTMKVSANGSDWVTGLVIDKTTGAVTVTNPVITPAATLPGSPVTGMEACVSTATSPTIGSALSLGGAAFAKAIYNGSQWTVTGK